MYFFFQFFPTCMHAHRTEADAHNVSSHTHAHTVYTRGTAHRGTDELSLIPAAEKCRLESQHEEMCGAEEKKKGWRTERGRSKRVRTHWVWECQTWRGTHRNAVSHNKRDSVIERDSVVILQASWLYKGHVTASVQRHKRTTVYLSGHDPCLGSNARLGE